MNRKLLLFAVASSAALLYRYTLVEALAYFPRFILTPGLLHATGRLGGEPLLRGLFLALDLLISTGVSFPFALLIASLYPRRWLLVAAAISSGLSLEGLIDTYQVWNKGHFDAWFVIYDSLSAIRLLLLLPALTFLVYWQTTSNRRQRTRDE